MTRFEGVEYGSKEYRRLASQEWRKNNPDYDREQKRQWRKANPEKNRLCAQASRHKHPIAPMLAAAKSRAKQKGLEFSLSKKDIIIPTYCPVLGIRIYKSTQKEDHSPSLDRVDNSRGYTKDNIKVISSRANTLKSDGSISEFEAIVSYMKDNQIES